MISKFFSWLISFWISWNGRSCYEISHQLYRIIDLKNKSNNEVYVFVGQTKSK